MAALNGRKRYNAVPYSSRYRLSSAHIPREGRWFSSFRTGPNITKGLPPPPTLPFSCCVHHYPPIQQAVPDWSVEKGWVIAKERVKQDIAAGDPSRPREPSPFDAPFKGLDLESSTTFAILPWLEAANTPQLHHSR